MLEIKVYGNPAPQGSKKFVGMRGGHGVLAEMSKKLKPWRDCVYHAARQAMGDNVQNGIRGPIFLEVYFTLPKPKSAPKTKITYPSTRPDCSKLVRSTEDALTRAGAYEDDGRIVETNSGKRYPNEGRYALDRPGAFIRISSYPKEGLR